MPNQLPVFEVVVEKSGRKTWRWRVCTTDGRIVMRGSENSRPAAKYYADRALFLLLLSAPYQSAKGAFAAGHLILDWAGSLFVDSPWLGPVRHDVGWNKTYLCAFGALRIIFTQSCTAR
jgi:hypothetical protein